VGGVSSAERSGFVQALAIVDEKLSMDMGRDRRRHPRFARNEIVRLTMLHDETQAAEARIVDASTSGVRLESTLGVMAGTLVKVEWKDTLLLGEVLYSQQSGPFTLVGVELTRALYGVSELRRLNTILTGSAKPRTSVARPDAVLT
jgi:hypothetical protein